MKKPFIISPEDRALFRQSIGNVKPIRRQDNVVTQNNFHTASTTKAKLRQRRALLEMQPLISDPISDQFQPIMEDNGDLLSYSRGGIQHRLFKKLRRGQIDCSVRLDLHGMRVSEARQALLETIEYCKRSSTKTLLIIHGRGNHSEKAHSVLKSKMNLWLRQLDAVLAFHSAQPKDGGDGATYVLLKSNNSSL